MCMCAYMYTKTTLVNTHTHTHTQDKVKKPCETRYTFTPKEDGNTEELCVKLFLQAAQPSRPDPPLPTDSCVSTTSSVTPTTSIPSRTLSSPQLSGVWATRSHVIRPPLEPRAIDSEVAAANRRESIDGMGHQVTKKSSAQSPAQNKTVKKKSSFVGQPLQGVWAKLGSSGALVVQTGGGEERTKLSRETSPVHFAIGGISRTSSSSSLSSEDRGRTPVPQPGGLRGRGSNSTSRLRELDRERNQRRPNHILKHSVSGPAHVNGPHGNRSRGGQFRTRETDRSRRNYHTHNVRQGAVSFGDSNHDNSRRRYEDNRDHCYGYTPTHRDYREPLHEEASENEPHHGFGVGYQRSHSDARHLRDNRTNQFLEQDRPDSEPLPRGQRRGGRGRGGRGQRRQSSKEKY